MNMATNSDPSLSLYAPPNKPELGWANVAIALSFVFLDAGISTVFRLGLSVSLIVAALRCVGQLAVVASLLQQVFEHENPWTVTLIACKHSSLVKFKSLIQGSCVELVGNIGNR